MSAIQEPPLTIIVYSKDNASTIEDNVGLPEYSYFFVLDAYRPMLEQLGEVIQVHDVTEVDPIFDRATAENRQCIFFSFTAPQYTCLDIRCPTICVFAWEYHDVPNENWSDGTIDNWVEILNKMHGAITHSNNSVEAVKRVLGDNYPVVSAPAPVWDEFALASSQPRSNLSIDPLILHTEVFDSNDPHDRRALQIAPEVDAPPRIQPKTISLEHSGVIYTTVFNPNDGRKNWEDLVRGFCYTFRDTNDATLIIKSVYYDTELVSGLLIAELRSLAPFNCRVLVIQGFLTKQQYKSLILLTDYIVNTSYGEGQCLPLMEFMSAGKPAISPRHSAMLDYLDSRNAFIVESSPEWTHWIHDPRLVKRTFRYRINWESLCEQFQSSYYVANNKLLEYSRRSRRAVRAQKRYCSMTKTTKTVSKYLDRIIRNLAFSK